MLWFMDVDKHCSQTKELNTANSCTYIHLKNAMDLNGACESLMHLQLFWCEKNNCVRFPSVTGSAGQHFEILVLSKQQCRNEHQTAQMHQKSTCETHDQR